MNLVFKLISSPWFWLDILLSVSGGVLVWWGLRVEKKAEKLIPPSDFKPDIFGDILDQQKRELERGWRILMRGIALEVIAALGISIISGLEIADLNERSEAANLEAKQAGKDAAAAKLAGVKLEQRVEELRKQNDELEAKVQDRKISPIEHARIVECLREGPRGVVIVDFDNMSGATVQHEAKEYAIQIASVLDEAGFIGSTNGINLAAINTPGVILFAKDTKHPPAEALSIQACFRANGILPSDIESGYAPDTNSVLVWVSTKP